MAVINSPNMNLPVPVVGQEAGPQYAQDVNTSLGLIDSHNHSPGSGVQITPDGLNINTALTFNSNAATDLALLNLTPQVTIPGLNTIYEAGVDLFYVDGIGNNIRITQGGGIAGTPGSIANLAPPASVSYVGAASTFVFQSNVNIAANLDAASILLRNISPNSTFALTLQPPTLGSNYSLTLPSLPVSTSFVTLTTTGAIAGSIPVSKSLTNANITDGTITQSLFQTGVQIPVIIQSKTTSYTTLITDGLILCDTTAAAFTVTLYTAVGNSGLQLAIKKTSNDLNTLTVATTSGQTIDGASTTVLNTINEEIHLISDGSNWVLLSRSGTTTVPVAYTPAFTSFGSVSTSNFKSWREGKYLVITGEFTMQTNSGSPGLFSVGFLGASANVVVDVSSMTTLFGSYGMWGSGTQVSSTGFVSANIGTTTLLNFTMSSSGFAAGNPVATASMGGGGTTIVLGPVRVPIVGWNA